MSYEVSGDRLNVSTCSFHGWHRRPSIFMAIWCLHNACPPYCLSLQRAVVVRRAVSIKRIVQAGQLYEDHTGGALDAAGVMARLVCFYAHIEHEIGAAGR